MNSFNITTAQVTYSIWVSHDNKSLFGKYYIMYKLPLKFLTTTIEAEWIKHIIPNIVPVHFIVLLLNLPFSFCFSEAL